jgi:hypothetical protein
MRINEILTESQLEQLDEGPIGSALGAVGRGIGKAVGGVAKGVGAVAGGVVGAGRALKKGYQAGKAVVGDDPDPNAGQPGYTDPAAAPAAGGGAPAAPAAGGGAAAPAAPSGAAPSTQDINAQGPAGTAPAKPQTGAAGAALAKTTAAVDKQTSTKAGETVYAQVKANVDKLDKKGKQRILQLLQKSMATPDPKPAAGAAPAGGAAAAPASKPGASPAAGGTGSGFNPDTGKPFASDAERAAYDASPAAKMPTADVEKAAAGGKPPNTMANAPVSATNKADPSNPNLATATPPAADADATATAPAGQGAFANVAQQLSKPAKDPAVKAAADAALAKPGFQRTASDKLAIKAAAETKSLAKGTASVFVK